MSAALDVLAGLVLEDGPRWGEVAEPFQWQDARAVLDADSATPYSFLTRGRGASKTADLAGMAVAVMVAQLAPASRLYAVAADRDQGRLIVDSVHGFAQRTPELRGVLEVGAYRVAATRGGSVLEILAADAPGAWGLRPSFVIADEVAQWGSTGAPRRLWEAVVTAVAKIRGCRLAVCTTAGDPAHWSRRVLDHALADPLWRVHEVPGPAPWLDPERLAEQRRRLPESAYRRLFLNEWVAADDRLASPEQIRALATLDGPLPPARGERYVVAVDLGLTKDATVAAVAHAEPLARVLDGDPPWQETIVGTRLVLDRLEVWQGTRDRPVDLSAVEAWVGQASDSYFNAQVVVDPWQAAGLAQRLRRRGVRVTEYPFTAQSVGRIARTLIVAIENQALALPDDEALLDELEHVRVRETTPGVYRLDHDADRHDDRAIALGLAAVTLLDRPPSGPGQLPSITGGSVSPLVEAVHGAAAWSLADRGAFTEARYGQKF